MSNRFEVHQPTHLDDDCNRKKDKVSDNLDARLLEHRTILVEGPVNDRMYRQVCGKLLYLDRVDSSAPILVVVNSPGGSADSGFGIYDTMRFTKAPIKTLCAGMCASAAVLIYLGGDKGSRFCLPHSRFLLHQPSTQAYGQASDMEITAREILRTRKKYAEIVAEETGLNSDKVVSDSNRDFWLDAEECKAYGLIDKIITSRDEMA